MQNILFFVSNKVTELILTRHCGSVYLGVVLDIGMYISWESTCTSVQGLMIGSTEYWDSLVCR